MTSRAESVRVASQQLRAFVTAVLVEMGIAPEDAAIGADALVEADLRGVETHGVQYLRSYVAHLRSGEWNARPNVRILREARGTAVMDGDLGMGHIVSTKAMRVAVDKAAECGIGAVAVRNSRHFGMAAHYSMLALPHDMIGWCTTTSAGGARIAPWGGINPLIGNNPQSYAIPAGEERPIVIDMAHSIAAGSKLRMAARRGERIPLGWALDKQGQPTDDPRVILDEPAHLLPIGGAKGYCLAVAMEGLATVLSGIRLPDGYSDGRIPTELTERGTAHWFQAIDVSKFMSVSEFKERVDALIRRLKTSKPRPGFERIYIPGEIEALEKEKRLSEGIPIHISVFNELVQLASELGLRLPF